MNIKHRLIRSAENLDADFAGDLNIELDTIRGSIDMVSAKIQDDNYHGVVSTMGNLIEKMEDFIERYNL